MLVWTDHDGDGLASIIAPLGAAECSIIAPLGAAECSIIAPLGAADGAIDGADVAAGAVQAAAKAAAAIIALKTTACRRVGRPVVTDAFLCMGGSPGACRGRVTSR